MNESLIVVVVYNKKINSLAWVFSAQANGKHVFIYDNSLVQQDVPVTSDASIYYEHDSGNSGVSRAYNRAALKAKELGLDRILILDQDTVFDLEVLNEYERVYKKYGDRFIYAPVVKNEVGDKVYSPAHCKRFIGKVQTIDEFVFEEVYSLGGKSLINSGLMIPLRIFDMIGGYNENLKLDFSDVYFIEQYKKINPEIILAGVYLKHSISGDEGKDFTREYNRFKYYCSAAGEIGRVLDSTVIWAPLRRLIRLTVKYKTFAFFKIFYESYIISSKA